MRDNAGKIIFDIERVAARWKEYIEELYSEKDNETIEMFIEEEGLIEIDSKGLPITQCEFDKAIHDLNEKNQRESIKYQEKYSSHWMRKQVSGCLN